LLLELETGMLFFGDDDAFLSRKARAGAHLHLRDPPDTPIQPCLWISLDWTYCRGGRHTIGGVQLSDDQSNSRFGCPFVKPISRRQVIKVGYATGVRARFGTYFGQFLLSYQLLFN
jgi:hypothetical protein